MAVSRVRQAGGRTGGGGCRWNDPKAEATGKRFIEKETMGRNEALFTGPRTEGGVEEEADLEMGRCLGERGPPAQSPQVFRMRVPWQLAIPLGEQPLLCSMPQAENGDPFPSFPLLFLGQKLRIP